MASLQDAFQRLFGDRRGLPQVSSGREFFFSETDFYDDDKRRERSPQADYGVMWRGLDGSEYPGWTVSYLGTTGEVIAQRGGSENKPASSKAKKDAVIVLLGVLVPDCDPFIIRASSEKLYYSTLDEVLQGWPQKMNDPLGLAWIKDQLNNFAIEKTNHAVRKSDI